MLNEHALNFDYLQKLATILFTSDVNSDWFVERRSHCCSELYYDKRWDDVSTCNALVMACEQT